MDQRITNFGTDKELVRQVLAGDRHAFGQVIRKTEGLVAMIVLKMVNNSSDRKDLVQDIYLKVFAKLGSFEFRCKLSTWVGQIAYNTCLHYLEKKMAVLGGSKNGISTLEGLSDLSIDIFTKESETLLIRKDLKQILQTAIERLPPVYRTLLMLYQGGLSNEEMAGVTSMPEGTIKNYLFRARKTLKEYLLSKYQKGDL